MSDEQRAAKAEVRAMNKARNEPAYTTPVCRHAATIAESMAKNGAASIWVQPDEVYRSAESIAFTVRLLWEARAALYKLGYTNTADGWVKE
ncbi:MAG: hypothetical protein U5N55_04800 [Cypionkella sp.]|nr:hypothetical protein [Cypionkella sp.]